MKKIVLIAAAVFALAACAPQQEVKRVHAREVPERADDFVFENDLIAGRIYGKALEGNPTSPGIDIWVKLPGKLVADVWYAAAMDDPDFYHHNHGGKDCYKVATSLGGGASVPVVDGELCYPATNYRSSRIVKQNADTVVFVLSYPEWEAAEGVKVSLDKQISVYAGSYFCRVDDIYTFSGADSLTVAAGVFRHPEQNTVEAEHSGEGVYAIWEHASDQSIEPEDGMLGVAVVVPGSGEATVTADGMHGLCTSSVASGEPFTYWFGSCWSKANVKTAEEWFALVDKQAR